MSTEIRGDSTTERGAERETGTDELQVHTGGRAVAPVRGRRAADLDTARVVEWWEGFREQLLARCEELDGVGGPLAQAAHTTDRLLGEAGAPTAPGDVFGAMAAGFSSVPGAPALLGAWFAEFARSCAREVGTHELADAAWAGLFAAQRAGGPPPGAGSLVDAMAPAADALAGADAADVPTVVALHAAYRAAADGTRHTVTGGLVDPGALAVTWFFERGTVV